MPNKDSQLRWGPGHVNGNVICAVDIRAGGDDADLCDLLEVCILPLNHSYKVHPNFSLFTAKIRPVWPVDKKIARVSEEELAKYRTSALDSVGARSAFERWCESTLHLKTHKKIMPLVWDYSRVKPFLKNWLDSSFDDLVSESVRDVLPLVNFINDRYDFWGENEVIFKHPTFGQFVNRSNLQLIERNSLMANCKALQEGYLQLLRNWIPGYSAKI